MSDTFRSLRIIVVIIVAMLGLWLALPSIVSALLERWFERQGYENVVVRLSSPGLRSMTVPNLALTQRLKGEVVTLSLNNSQLKYTLLGLFAGRIDLLVLADLSIEIRMAQLDGGAGGASALQGSTPDAPDSLLNVLTASDLVQRLPLLPCDEVHIGQLKVFREQATGPLQTVMMTGKIKPQSNAVVVEMLLQGVDTIPYELRMTSESPADMLIQLKAAQPNAVPILLWRSESSRKETQVQLKGVVEVNVQELAPFLALAVPIGSEWQRVNGSVTVHWAGTAALDVPLASLWKDPRTEVNATVQVTTALPELKGYGKDIVVKLTGTFSGNQQLVHWTLAPGTFVTAVVNARTILPTSSLNGLQPFVIESAKEIQGELFWTESPPRFTASGPLALSYGSPKGPVHVEFAGTQLSGHGSIIDRAEAHVRVRGSLPPAISEPLGLVQPAGDLDGVITLNGVTLHGTIKPDSAVTFAQFRHDALVMNRGAFHLMEPLSFDVDTATGLWSAGPATFGWVSPQILVGGLQTTTHKAGLKLNHAEGSGKMWNVQATAMIDGLTISQPATPPLSMTVHMTADALSVKADIHAQSADKFVGLEAHFEQMWSAERGSMHGRLGPTIFDPNKFRLRQLVSPWPYSFDATQGSVAGSFELAWKRNADRKTQIHTGSAEMFIEDLTGTYGDIAFSGLKTKIKIIAEGSERIVTSRPADVTIASVNTGVELHNMAMTVQGEWDLREQLPVVEVRDFRCDVMDGTATSQGVRAELSHPPFAFTVLVRQLNLSKVLNLERQKGLQGTGVLDGSIPVTISANGLSVTDGFFEARPPGGVIQYRATPEAAKIVTQANANMQIVLQALNNFHYNVLQVGAQYSEEGIVRLKARLEGKNPDQSKSPPIHFNLAIQENIPALLKSLRLVDDIEQSVQRRFVKP